MSGISTATNYVGWTFFTVGCYRRFFPLTVPALFLVMVYSGAAIYTCSTLRPYISLVVRSLPNWRTSRIAVGFLLLALVGVAGMFLASFLIWGIAFVAFKLSHTFPPCSAGRCSSRDYGWVIEEIFGWEQGRIFRYHCRCGIGYLRYRSRFFVLSSDGSIVPFRRYSRDTGWVRDLDPVPTLLRTARRDAWYRGPRSAG